MPQPKPMSREFLRAFWALARPYWVSSARGKGLALLAAVVGLALGLVWLQVQFNAWYKDFYDSLENKNADKFYASLILFTAIGLGYIVVGVYKLYLQQMLQIEWRSWLTENLLADWLRDRAYYRLQLADAGTDNPDQRIAEDLRLFVDDTLSLSLGLLSAVVTLVSFVAILWALSGPMTIPVAGGIEVPGYLVWCAVLYALVGSVGTHLIGRRLVGLNYDQQKYEADFRYSLMRLRENAEGVALYRGEAGEAVVFRARFGNVIRNWWAIMKKTKQLSWFTVSIDQLAVVFPYVVVAPRFFSGAIAMGTMVQTATAFGQVRGALSWFIDAYAKLAEWSATVERLRGFVEALERARAEAAAGSGERAEGDSPQALSLEGVTLGLPDGGAAGRTLLAGATLEWKRGESVLVAGASGAGKSTLFRALAGIWPYWKGRIRLPRGGRLLFLPQRPYLPIGPLKRSVAYPAPESDVKDEDLRAALADVGLAHLAGDLEREETWSQVLSGGEQQRLAFARALVNRPDWLFLDEATAALPEAAQAELYALLRERLPGTTLVSIGHRDSLARWHERRLAWRDAQLVPA